MPQNNIYISHRWESEDWAVACKLRDKQPLLYSDFETALNPAETEVALAVVAQLNAERQNGTDLFARLPWQAENEAALGLDFLCMLERICLATGQMEIAFQLRMVLENRILREHTVPEERYYVKQLWTFLVYGQKQALETLTAAASVREKLHNADNVERLLYFFCETKKEPAFIGALRQVEENAAFYELIHQKKVVIVGPAPNPTPPNLAAYDVVVRMNFWPQNEEEKDKTRTDVSYYSGVIMRRIQEEETDSSLFANLKGVVYKSLPEAAARVPAQNSFARELVKQNEVLFEGQFTFVPYIVWDLFHFAPNEIMVSGINLYRSHNRYIPGYRRGSLIQNHTLLLYTFGTHNLVSQFDYLKALQERGTITLDALSADVLSLTRSQYMRDLDAIFNTNIP